MIPNAAKKKKAAAAAAPAPILLLQASSGIASMPAATLVGAAKAVEAGNNEAALVAAQLQAQGGAGQTAAAAADQVDKLLRVLGLADADRAALRAWLTGTAPPPGGRSIAELRAIIAGRSPVLEQQLAALAKQAPPASTDGGANGDCGCGCAGQGATGGGKCQGGVPWLAIVALLLGALAGFLS